MNLFMHYAFDCWMQRHLAHCPFARYADDAVVHCRTQEQAQEVMQAIASRLAECGLTMHPEKSKIVYCKDRSRTQAYPNVTFTFLGFQFRPRRAQTKHGHVSTSFLPGGQSCCLETDARAGAGVAAYGPNLKAPCRSCQAMQSHDTWVVELLWSFLSISHAGSLSVFGPKDCALGSAQVQDTATPQATR